MPKIRLQEDEQLDDLLIDGRKIIQQKDGYHFTSDSVRLAKFVEFKDRDKICEFCAGSGIISILLAIDGANDLTCIELQKDLANICQKNVKINNFEDKIKVLNDDLVDIHKKIGCEVFDAVICNPPFEKARPIFQKTQANIAKFELCVNLKQIAKEASRLLKFKGKFFAVVPAKRLFEFDSYLNEFGFKIKETHLFCPKNDECDTAYVCAVKGAKDGAKIKVFK